MSAEMYIGLSGGQISRMREMYVGLSGGNIARIREIYAGLSGGNIARIYRNAVRIGLTTTVKNVDLYLLAGSPTSRLDIEVYIDAGVIVYSDTTLAAMYCSVNLPTGSRIRIYNSGSIYGRNGDGGNGLSWNDVPKLSSADGGKGYPALSLGADCRIWNGSGEIFGGGGGGGGGQYSMPIYATVVSGAGGGGYVIGNGGLTKNNSGPDYYAADGSQEAYAVAAGGAQNTYAGFGYGGAGGQCNGAGEVGSDGARGYLNIYGTTPLIYNGYDISNGSGGAVGNAVEKNGFDLTWETGGVAGTDYKGSIIA